MSPAPDDPLPLPPGGVGRPASSLTSQVAPGQTLREDGLEVGSRRERASGLVPGGARAGAGTGGDLPDGPGILPRFALRAWQRKHNRGEIVTVSVTLS